jgi:hypothetical protein
LIEIFLKGGENMEIVTAIFVSMITGIISLLAFYHAFSKKVEQFYEDASETIDTVGLFLFVGLLGKGLHKLYKKIFTKHHIIALKITTFIFGSLFLVIAVGVWFIDLKPFLEIGLK